jgi:hypothetical protein
MSSSSLGSGVFDPLGFDRQSLRPELQTDEAFIRLGEVNSLVFTMLGPHSHTNFMQFPTLLANQVNNPPIAEAMLDAFKRCLLAIMVANTSNRAASANPVMSTMEKNAQRKACTEKICKLIQGECILSWTKNAREVINHADITLPDDEKLSVVRMRSKEGDQTVSHLIDNHDTCKKAVTAEQYLAALEKLFEAKEIQCHTALSNFKQPHNMKAKDYAAEAERICKICWAPLPCGVTQIMSLISNMSDKHRPFMEDLIEGLNNVKSYGQLKEAVPVTFTTFLTWCEQSDARYSRVQDKVQGRTNNAQGGNGRDPKNRNNNNQGNGNNQGGNRPNGNNNNGPPAFQKRDKYDLRNNRNSSYANTIQVDASTPVRKPVQLIAGSPCTPTLSSHAGMTPEFAFQKFVISSPQSERFRPLTDGLEEGPEPDVLHVCEKLAGSVLLGREVAGISDAVSSQEESDDMPALEPLMDDDLIHINMMFAAPSDPETPPQPPPQVEDFAPMKMPFEGESSPVILAQIVGKLFQLPPEHAENLGTLMYDADCFPFLPKLSRPENDRGLNPHHFPRLVADFPYDNTFDSPMVLKRSWSPGVVLVLPGIRLTSDGVFVEYLSGTMSEPLTIRIPIDPVPEVDLPPMSGILSSTPFVQMLYNSGPARSVRTLQAIRYLHQHAQAAHFQHLGSIHHRPEGPFSFPCTHETFQSEGGEPDGEIVPQNLDILISQQLGHTSRESCMQLVHGDTLSCNQVQHDDEFDFDADFVPLVHVGTASVVVSNFDAEFEDMPSLIELDDDDEDEPILRTAMMEALDEEETIMQLVDEVEGEVNTAGSRPTRNRPHNAEPYRKEDREDYQQNGKFYLPAHARPEVRLAGAVFTSSLAGLVMLWKNPNTPALINALAKILNMTDQEVIEGAKEAVQSVAVAAKQLQSSISPEAGYVGYPYRKYKPTAMEMICTHAIDENYTPVVGVTSPEDKIIHKTASMPAFAFSFLGRPDERIGHLDTGCNINIVSYRAMARDRSSYGEKCKISKVRPFTVQFADGRTTSAAYYAVEDAVVVVGAAKYEVDFVVMENLSTEYLFGFPWFTTYNVQLLPFISRMSIGICKDDFLSEEDVYQPYQEVDIRFNVKALTLYPRN